MATRGAPVTTKMKTVLDRRQEVASNEVNGYELIFDISERTAIATHARRCPMKMVFLLRPSHKSCRSSVRAEVCHEQLTD